MCLLLYRFEGGVFCDCYFALPKGNPRVFANLGFITIRLETICYIFITFLVLLITNPQFVFFFMSLWKSIWQNENIHLDFIVWIFFLSLFVPFQFLEYFMIVNTFYKISTATYRITMCALWINWIPTRLLLYN